MLISGFVKKTAFYIIYVVSFLIIFQTANVIMSAGASTIQDPDRNSVDRSDMSFRIQDQQTDDLKKQFESGMEESNRDNWIFVNHDIYGTRNSNQTQIDKSNVADLKVKWRLKYD